MPHNEVMTELWKCFWLWYPSSFNWADLGDFFFFFLVILFLLTSLSAVKPFDSFCVSLYRTVWFWCAHWLQPQTLVVRGEPFSLPSLVSDSITVLNCCHLLFQEDLFSKTRSTLQKYWDTSHFFIIVCFKGASLSFIILKCSWAVVLHVKCKAVGGFFYHLKVVKCS